MDPKATNLSKTAIPLSPRIRRSNVDLPLLIADARSSCHDPLMEKVYLLHHVRSDEECGNDAKLIGVYRSPEAAVAAARRLLVQPSFRDHPEGFQTDAYTLDQDHWCEGFGFKA
jgi:hypothetical protein